MKFSEGSLAWLDTENRCLVRVVEPGEVSTKVEFVAGVNRFDPKYFSTALLKPVVRTYKDRMGDFWDLLEETGKYRLRDKTRDVDEEPWDIPLDELLEEWGPLYADSEVVEAFQVFDRDDDLWVYRESTNRFYCVTVSEAARAASEGLEPEEMLRKFGPVRVTSGSAVLPKWILSVRDKAQDRWDLDRDSGRWVYAVNGSSSHGLSWDELLRYWGPVTILNVSDTVKPSNPRKSRYVKPRDSVYEVLEEFEDGSFSARDVRTGEVVHSLSELFEETKPPLPLVGEVWVRETRSDGLVDGVAFLVQETFPESCEVLMLSSFDEVLVSVETLRESGLWRNIY
jgi:hypothetical protein